jgi:hypothetical protein
MTMTLETAAPKIRALCPPAADPPLNPDQVQQMMTVAVTYDEDGEPFVSITGIYRAALEGWVMKAANAAGRFDVTTDGQMFRRSQVVDHCEAMASQMRRRLAGSLGVQ